MVLVQTTTLDMTLVAESSVLTHQAHQQPFRLPQTFNQSQCLSELPKSGMASYV